MERPGKFSGTLITQWLDPTWRKLVQSHPPFQYITAGGEIIKPDAGFMSDFGSIPYPANIIITCSLYAPCFVIHDWLCRPESGYTWKRAAQILRESIYTLTCGDAVIRRRLVYFFVRQHGLLWRK